MIIMTIITIINKHDYYYNDINIYSSNVYNWSTDKNILWLS
jgi:hypothetical protein